MRFYQYVDDWDNWYIELYENFPCNNKEELNKREEWGKRKKSSAIQ